MIPKRTIDMAIARRAEAVIDDQRSVVAASRMLKGEYGLIDVCLSIPAVIGISGIEAAVTPGLDVAGILALRHSAATMQAGIGEIRI